MLACYWTYGKQIEGSKVVPSCRWQTHLSVAMCLLNWPSKSCNSMNSMKLVIPLHSLYWSIHTKDESKRGTAFAFIFGVN